MRGGGLENVWNWNLKRYAHVFNHFSHVWLFATLWTIVSQAPLSMGFSRQEYRSGFPCPLPGDLPNPGIEPMAPEYSALQANLYWWATGEALRRGIVSVNCTIMVIGVRGGRKTRRILWLDVRRSRSRGARVLSVSSLCWSLLMLCLEANRRCLQIHTLKWTHHLSKM